MVSSSIGIKSAYDCGRCTKMIISREDHADKEGYWICGLKSLATEPRRNNELNDVRELEALTNNLKEVHDLISVAVWNGQVQ